jgi:ribosomal protein S3AE
MAVKEKGRRVVDKWKKKQWFTFVSSKTFNKKPLAETPAEKPIQLIGRTIKVTLDTLTGQRTKRDFTVVFKNDSVQGQTINTFVSKYYMSPGSLIRLLRRRNSKVSLVKKIPVKDGIAMITVIVITAKKAVQSQKTGVREVISNEIDSLKNMDFEDVVKETLFGNISNTIFKNSSKVCLIKKVVIAKATFTKK